MRKLSVTSNPLFISLLIPLSFVAACEDDTPDPPASNIVELAQADARLSTLAGLIADAGLAQTLSGGSFTVLAPTDEAFNKIPAADLEALKSDTAALSRILQYHVVSGEVKAEQIVTLNEATTLIDETLTIEVSGGEVTLIDGRSGRSKVIETDIDASNGVIHLIDTVLMPKEEEVPAGTIVDVATTAGFSTLIEAATAAGLAGALSGPGPLTVFAPTNEAFTALGAAVPTDPGLLANVLLHHVVSGSQDSAAVTAAASFTSLANTTLAIDAAANPLTVGGANLSSTLDVEASNGIIHVMDQVIVPPTILEAAVASPDLSTLETAVLAASAAVSDTLSGPGPITVFAPIDSAFAAIDPDELNALLQDQAALDRVLTYHVATGQSLSSDLSDGQMITMASGDILTVNVSGGNVTLTDLAGNTVNVASTDIRLLNGTVHLIDGVLLPVAGPGNIVEVATEQGAFGSLLGAATAVGLANTLAEGGPFTVFAPTDDAFTNLGVDLGPVDASVIANILLQHVVPGTFDSTAVVATPQFVTAATLPLVVDASGAPITIGGANLSATLDVAASNGIIHVMEQVIVPPTIVDVAQATPDLSVLVSAVGQASMAVQSALAPNTLQGDAPLTVFAPTNDAFVASGIDLMTVPQATLDAVLSHHVIAGQTVSSDLAPSQTVGTLNGDITIDVDAEGNISITDGMGNTANVIATLRDIRTLTGVVHVIDAVLMPQ